ncbi:MAG TPA: hypothetical protein VHS99_25390 [Chloroflexota bacterium]|nr:hypothetical protein [Chloroflexota bacterium]
MDKPGGWKQLVGCVAYEAPDALVLIDPLAPPEGTPDHQRFWSALDGDVERSGRPLAILLGDEWHDRSARAMYDRYRERTAVTVWAHEAARGAVDCQITDFVREGASLPGGVVAYEIGVPYPSEVVYSLPAHQALVCADCVVGAGDGKLRLAPSWWAGEAPAEQERYRTAFRPSLRRLLDLPLELIVTSHGPPVLQEGRAALAAALDAPAWGEE